MMENENEILTLLKDHLTTKHWILDKQIFSQSNLTDKSVKLTRSTSFLSTSPSKSLLSNTKQVKLARTSSSPHLSFFDNQIEDVIEEFDDEDIGIKELSTPIVNKSPAFTLKRIETWDPTPQKFRLARKNQSDCLSVIYRELTGADELEEELNKLIKSDFIYIQDDHELIHKYKNQFVSVHDEFVDDSTLEIQFSLDDIKQKMAKKTKYRKLEQEEDALHYKQKYFKSLDASQAECSAELSRSFDKTDFDRVQIVCIFQSLLFCFSFSNLFSLVWSI